MEGNFLSHLVNELTAYYLHQHSLIISGKRNMLGDFVSFLCSKASPATPPFRNCPQTSFLKSFQYNFILQSVDEMMEQLISSSK